MTPEEGHIFHNRLTHTLEVAQIARRLAEKLLAEQSDLAGSLGGIDPDVVEAAALAHDLGHPPFGHIAERELDELGRKNGAPDGFEGNAQSFRTLTRTTAHRIQYRGLNLTRATLNAVLKYPWLRDSGHPNSKKYRKFGAYGSERAAFIFARQGYDGDGQSVEAAIMDYADSTAYSVHDLDDFYRAGLIPLERLVLSGDEFNQFVQRWKGRSSIDAAQIDARKEACLNLLQPIPVETPYTGTFEQRALLRTCTSGLIGKFIHAARLGQPSAGEPPLVVGEDTQIELDFLKGLIWDYVILNPRLATQQYGQRKVIQTLFDTYLEEIKRGEEHFLPPRFHRDFEELAEAAADIGMEAAQARLAIDIVANFTDDQAISMFRRLTGISAGSVVEILHG